MDEQMQSLVKEANKIFSLDNIPADITYNPEGKSYQPIPEETHQVLVEKIVLKENPYYRPPTDEDWKNGTVQNKYQFDFTFMLLEEGDFQGRKVWDTTGLYIKPTTKQGKGGPTKLYTIVTKIMGTDMDPDDCRAFAPDMATLYRNLLEVCQGKQVRITTTNIKKADGKIKTKIAAYSYLKKDKDGKDIELPIPEKKEVVKE